MEEDQGTLNRSRPRIVLMLTNHLISKRTDGFDPMHDGSTAQVTWRLNDVESARRGVMGLYDWLAINSTFNNILAHHSSTCEPRPRLHCRQSVHSLALRLLCRNRFHIRVPGDRRSSRQDIDAEGLDDKTEAWMMSSARMMYGGSCSRATTKSYALAAQRRTRAHNL